MGILSALCRLNLGSGNYQAKVPLSATTQTTDYSVADTDPCLNTTAVLLGDAGGSGSVAIIATTTQNELKVEIGNRDIAITTESVSNSSGTILAANANRQYLCIQNNDVDDIWINFGAPAVVDQGFKVYANGGVWELNTVVPTDDVRAITDSGSPLTKIITVEG